MAPSIQLYVMAQSSGGNLFVYFSNSNLAGKLIVLALLLFSLLAWSIMISKYMDLSRLKQLNLAIERQLQSKESILALSPKNSDSGPYAGLVSAAIEAVHRFNREGASNATLMAHVENALQRTVARQSNFYESKMVLLGSILTGAPFMGLLGTVWGVMDAFGNMGAQNATTLQSLAPGISGALLTTVAGLLVAIPSVFGYNFLLTQSKLMITELENFASSLADAIELELK